jgi:uncharacterized protein
MKERSVTMENIDPTLIVHDEIVPGGSYWHRIINRWQTLRIIALERSRGVAFLCYNADNTIERFNAADTAKIQFNAFLKKGMVIYSDMGRVLFSITDNTVAYHDTLGGCSNAITNAKKYGESNLKNSRSNFLLALAKRNMDKRDIMPNLNFFAQIAVDPDGKISYVSGSETPGNFVDLRAEMNVLAVLSNCPNPLDPSPTYDPKPVRVIVYNSAPPSSDDLCRNANPEVLRGFVNTDALFV